MQGWRSCMKTIHALQRKGSPSPWLASSASSKPKREFLQIYRGGHRGVSSPEGRRYHCLIVRGEKGYQRDLWKDDAGRYRVNRWTVEDYIGLHRTFLEVLYLFLGVLYLPYRKQPEEFVCRVCSIAPKHSRSRGTDSSPLRILCRGIWRETNSAVKWIDKRIIGL